METNMETDMETNMENNMEFAQVACAEGLPLRVHRASGKDSDFLESSGRSNIVPVLTGKLVTAVLPRWA